ncbi:MAG TPA: hypothetical protein VLC09_16520, partial [Polyangiaceae bacterium]|nr:hypothetical protein [Polyangiaceae bacterium]
MRRLTSSLAFITVLLPASAFAQVVLEEDPAAAEPAAAPAEPATAGASASASTTAAPAVATTAATPPPPAAEAAPAARPHVGRTIGGPDSEVGTWQMTYSGYFRAPFRMGIGSSDATTVNSDGTTGSKGTTLHSPVIPDDQYSSW